MVLLDAMASARSHEIAAVATFDHGTGSAATKAAALVERTAMSLELPVVSGTMPRTSAEAGSEGRGAAGSEATGSEATWREARWRFLNGWAAELQATIVTAHTRDDQIETVVMRLLRESGVRGLAGMFAQSAIARPLLDVPRDAVRAYAAARHVPFIEDPSNATLAHLRNRVRHELLPALERVAPGFGAWCWEIAERSADWRTALARLVEAELGVQVSGQAVIIPVAPVRGLQEAHWAIVWPELAGRIGVVMDWRGIARASAWAPTATAGARIPLSGGAVIERTATTFVLRGSSFR